jgi:hypothetical protein
MLEKRMSLVRNIQLNLGHRATPFNRLRQGMKEDNKNIKVSNVNAIALDKNTEKMDKNLYV